MGGGAARARAFASRGLSECGDAPRKVDGTFERQEELAIPSLGRADVSGMAGRGGIAGPAELRGRRRGVMAARNTPALVISLDFELYWGVRDHLELNAYKENILGVRQAVPALLELFAGYGIHATWATVGFLFCRNREEILASVPDLKPHYVDGRLSPYDSIGEVGASESDDPFHYAPSLIAMIAK